MFASAFNFAASSLASSEMSCRLSFASVGDGGWDVPGVEGWEATSLVLELLDMSGR